MAVFITSNERHTFTLNPKVRKAPIGWVIDAYCNDVTVFGGHYTKTVGYRDLSGGIRPGFVGYRLKRDAMAAMAEAISLGILKVTK